MRETSASEQGVCVDSAGGFLFVQFALTGVSLRDLLASLQRLLREGLDVTPMCGSDLQPFLQLCILLGDLGRCCVTRQ